MTYEEIRDNVVRKYGYSSWEDFDDKSTFAYNHSTPKIVDEIAKLYAHECSRTSDSWMFTGTDKYHFQYRISFPMGNGSYRETGTINVTIPADSAQEAKQKLIKFVRQKVQVTVIDVKQSS